MTNTKQLAENLRRYNAWRRNNDEDLTLEMPNPKDLGVWIDSAIAVLEAHAENNDLARRVERLAAERDALAAELQKAKGDRDIWAAEHERQIEEQRAMATELARHDAADALEKTEAARMAAISRLCEAEVACATACQERDALAAELKAVRGNQTPTVEDINLQEWKGMDGACAWHLIDRYAEDWHHTARLMNAWLEANREELIAELTALREQEPIAWFCHSNDGGYYEFSTFQAAAGCASDELAECRAQAKHDGEWPEDVVSIKFGAVLGHLTELKGETDGEGWVDYQLIWPVPAEPVNALLLDALKKCRDQFDHYVSHHINKGEFEKAARRVRIEWNIGGTSGHGKWFDRSNRSALMVQCLEMSIKHGVGSHRIVDEDQSGEAGYEND